MSIIHLYLEPKIKLNKSYKTRINMSDIKAQVDVEQKKWDKGIDLQSNKTTIENINKFVKFKILKYKAYNFKDNKLQEVYKEDFNNFIIQVFRDYN